MMTREQWNELTGQSPASEGNCLHKFELYFEEDNINEFVRTLDKDIKIFTAFEEAPWGQRTVRFLDPDEYVIEVSEPMEAVVTRFLSS